MSKLKIKVILGSTRQGRFSEYPGQWISGLANARGDMDVEVLDLRDHTLPFYNEPFSPSGIEDGNYPNAAAKKWANKIREADGYIVIAPEYNHGYPAVLKNAMDHVYKEWNKKAIGFVSYGSVGGTRSVEQLRLVSIELQMTPIRDAVHIRAPWNMREDDGSVKMEKFDSLKEFGTDFLDELHWWASALKVARENK